MKNRYMCYINISAKAKWRKKYLLRKSKENVKGMGRKCSKILLKETNNWRENSVIWISEYHSIEIIGSPIFSSNLVEFFLSLNHCFGGAVIYI